NNIADLRQINVRAEGGRGGESGDSGYGTAGCSCRWRRWEKRTCTGNPGDPNYSCKTEEFDCEDGENGRDGRRGRRGNKGELGRLALVKDNQRLAADQPTANVSLSSAADRTISLSKNIWQTRRGANSLLASGSIISDEYDEFVERVEGEFQVVWNASRPITDFYNQNLSLTLEGRNDVNIVSPEDVWLESETSQNNGITQLNITKAVLRQEATQLTRADFAGNRSGLTFSLIDKARQSDVLATQFRIKYRTGKDRSGPRPDSVFNYTTRYEGTIPGELVKLEGQRFTLDLGKLPIDSEYLRPGVNVDLEITAVRSLGGRSAEQTISWKGEID
ncbi:MAG: hypothetical protein WA896_14185, partial [Spirulinaceae cyanobacterium]